MFTQSILYSKYSNTKGSYFFLGGGGWEGQLFCDFKVLMHFRSNWKLEVLVYEGSCGGKGEGTRVQEKKPLEERK